MAGGLQGKPHFALLMKERALVQFFCGCASELRSKVVGMWSWVNLSVVEGICAKRDCAAGHEHAWNAWRTDAVQRVKEEIEINPTLYMEEMIELIVAEFPDVRNVPQITEFQDVHNVSQITISTDGPEAKAPSSYIQCGHYCQNYPNQYFNPFEGREEPLACSCGMAQVRTLGPGAPPHSENAPSSSSSHVYLIFTY